MGKCHREYYNKSRSLSCDAMMFEVPSPQHAGLWRYGTWVDRARGHGGDDKDATVVAVIWLWNGGLSICECREVERSENDTRALPLWGAPSSMRGQRRTAGSVRPIGFAS